MAHTEQKEFVRNLKNKYPTFFNKKKVLDIGSLDLNGSVKDHFVNCDYTGIDIGPGKNVDIVCEGQKYDAPDESYDVVCSLECFEHNPYWTETFLNMIRLCKSGGLIFFTCATTGRKEHGTVNSLPQDSPLTLAHGWNYYKNLIEEDFTSKINFDEYFKICKFNKNEKAKDLYFWGMKK
jgi:SAM-dependent methyltransferase